MPKDKFFKANLLMPYGIHINAFMITNKDGDARPLDKFYDENTSQFEIDTEKYYK